MARDCSWCRWELVGRFAKSVSGQLTAHCIFFTAYVSCGVRHVHFLSVEIFEAEGSTKEAGFFSFIYWPERRYCQFQFSVMPMLLPVFLTFRFSAIFSFHVISSTFIVTFASFLFSDPKKKIHLARLCIDFFLWFVSLSYGYYNDTSFGVCH
jgi:hypothetical protein